MITQRVSATNAIANANSSLATASPECVLYREELMALLDHIGDLEFEISKLKGTVHLTHPVAVLYGAIAGRIDQ